MNVYSPDANALSTDSAELLSECGYASLPPPPDSTFDTPLTERFPAPRDGATLQERFASHWIDLLRQAVEQPGLISEAYTRFHGYSLGNRLVALIQCQLRGLDPGPLNTFYGWGKLGYTIREGEKALTLCMPLKNAVAREKAPSVEVAPSPTLSCRPDVEVVEYIRAFVWKPRWFVLAQTRPLDSDTVQPLVAPAYNEWDGEAALAALNIHRIPFDSLNGNFQGLARGRGIAVSPLATLPENTFFHEIAHIVLGHTEPAPLTVGHTGHAAAGPTLGLTFEDEAVPTRSVQEAEAEGVALLLLDTFGLPGQPEACGYIQHWLRGEELSEKSAQRIFGAADRILSAGLGEGRVRYPTVDDLDWSEHGEHRPNALERLDVYDAAPRGAGAAPIEGEAATAAGMPAGGANRLAEGRNGDGPGVCPPLPASPLPGGPLPSPAPLAFLPGSPSAPEGERPELPPVVEPADGISSGETSCVGAALDATPVLSPVANARAAAGAMFAWQLHGRLLRLYDELHPENAADRAGIAYGLRHLAHLDPISEREVRALVVSASRALKAAYVHLETVLESDGDYGGESIEGSGSIAEGKSVKGGESPNLEGGGGEAASPLPARRQEAARRSVGRELRAELQSEKARFLEAARRHGFKVGESMRRRCSRPSRRFWMSRLSLGALYHCTSG